MDFERWYQTEIESNQEDPPEALWASIQDELDTDLVWHRLSGKLPARRLPVWARLSAAASVALLAGMAAWFFYFGKFTTPLPAPLAAEEASPTVQELTPSATEIFQHPESQPAVLALEQIPSKRKANDDSPSLVHFEAEEKDNFVAIDEVINVLRPKPVGEIETATMPETNIKSSAFNSLEAEFLALIEPEKTKPAFSIGILGQFANTWLLNQKTLRGLQSQELTNTNASFGKNIGIAAFVPISAKAGFKTELLLFSQSRQHYQEYIRGRYSSTSLELDYTSISILYSHRLGSGRSPHLLSAGAYASALVQARQLEGSAAQKVKDQYSNADMGLVAGYEYLIPVSDQLFLSTGVFARYGLTNAFSGTNEIPGYLNHTRNAAFVFSLSLNYSFE